MTAADSPVCVGHSSPLDILTCWLLDRPDVSLVHGPRGGGKSYLSALDTHINSNLYDRHGTKILGGSLAQSRQIYEALVDFDHARPGTISKFNKETAHYVTGSDVSILAASPKSVRGPHVPSLKLDEVDEIEDDLRDSAMGMCMSKRGLKASVALTSTWHRVGGPMARLIERGRSGDFPVMSFCAFEVIERCPESRSGPNLENCPACPLFTWCHDGSKIPKAKRASGHYAIDSLIQKTKLTSARAFESDYLCLAPRADGVWFPGFDPASNVSTAAEFDPLLPVHMSVDSGVFTGAILMQCRPDPTGVAHVTIFADYLSEGLTAEANARALIELARARCGGRMDRVSTDPAGGSRNPVGPTVIAEYQRVGLQSRRGIDRWPHGSVADGLALVEGLVRSADGRANLTIHPRCSQLIAAFQSYRRAKRAGQFQDYPEDPQHPHEDLIDAVRGAVRLELPQGRKPKPALTTRHVSQVIY